MIKINALFFLLIIEVSVLLAATIIYLVLRMKKIGNLYRISAKALEDARGEHNKLQKRLTEAAVAANPAQDTPKETQAPSAAPATSVSTEEYENCKIELSILRKKVDEKTTLLNNLQAKFDDLEKEYLILYHQQHSQDQ